MNKDCFLKDEKIPLKQLTKKLKMLENIFTLLMLVLLQAVLGFDNLLYISLESKKSTRN
jgi:predicted tellurium resistance membrane protein TerC